LATLQQIIAEKFFEKLAEDKAIDASKVEALRALLQKGQKAKADDFVRVFTTDAGDLV
jgi:hypothetical protein